MFFTVRAAPAKQRPHGFWQNCSTAKNAAWIPNSPNSANHAMNVLECRQIDAQNSFDVIEIDAASNRGIDEIRNLKENITASPATASHKVYIIDEAHMLTGAAFNALLKTLEEPPRHAVIVLATTEYEKLPPTITSRTQRFSSKSSGKPTS